VASSRGLGYVIMIAQSSFKTSQIFAALLILAIIGTVLFFLLDWLDRILVPWHLSRQREDLAEA
jgi:NitT/TauT family transport system permease protein